MKQQLKGIAGILAIGTLCFASNAFAVKTDDIHSTNIKEADGTSGQDTNSGDGVKTGHIQDDAVTDAKISDVSMGKVTGLVEAIEAIPAGPVGPMGQTGPVGPAGPVGPQGPEGPAAVYGNVTVVALSGGDYNNPVDAVNWCGTPSADNPCLVKVMPGVYDIGSSGIHVAAYITLEGAGQNVTKIIGSYTTSTIYGGVLSIGSDSLVKDITIENTAITAEPNTVALTKGYGSDGKLVNVTAISNGNDLANHSYAIRMLGGATDLTNVTAIATGATSSNFGIHYILQTGDNNLKGANVLAYGDGVANTAVHAWSYYDYPQFSSERGINISDSKLKADGAASNSGFSASSSAPSITQKNVVHDSIITGSGSSISSSSAPMAFRISDSQLAGPLGIPITAATSCSNVYDEDFTDVVCP